MITTKERYSQYMYSYPHKTAYRDFPHPIPMESMASELKKQITLYTHIPFCSTKCGFCNLCSIATSQNDFIDSYVNALENQIEILGEDYSPNIKDFVLGGGTPLMLSANQLTRVFRAVESHFSVDFKSVPTIVETSPTETTPEKLDVLEQFHTHRVSIGVQSFVESELPHIHRNHSVTDAHKALELLQERNFPIVNVDLIYGIPTQTIISWKNSLSQALFYSPEEIFLYPLYIRKNLTIENQRPKMHPLYEFGRDLLLQAGYQQQSMRRFSKKPDSVRTCGFENMLALGYGGRSYLGNLHTCAPYSHIPATIKQGILNFIKKPVLKEFSHGIQLCQDEQWRRFLMKNLFVTGGFPLNDFKENFQSPLLESVPLVAGWVEDGFFEIKNMYILPTEQGLGLSDFLAPQLISSNVKNLTDEWTVL